jgi:hypothetical protein
MARTLSGLRSFHTALTRYAATSWRFDAKNDTPPEKYKDSPRALDLLFGALKITDGKVISEQHPPRPDSDA